MNDMYFKFNISKAYRRLARIMEHENTVIYVLFTIKYGGAAYYLL